MKINQVDLSIMLKEHGEWLKSDGVSGRQLNLAGAILDQLDLTGADLRYAVLKDAKLIRAIINKADLSFADLRGARLDYAKCANAKFSNSLMSGVSLEGAYLIFSNFAGSLLNSADFRYSDCGFCEFKNAKLTESELGGANFTKCNFSECIFLGNCIEGAVFAGAEIDESLLRAEHDEGDSRFQELRERADSYSSESDYYIKRVLEMGCYYVLAPLGLLLIAFGAILRLLSYFEFSAIGRNLISSIDGYEVAAIGFLALITSVLLLLIYSFIDRNRVSVLSGILGNSIGGGK